MKIKRLIPALAVPVLALAAMAAATPPVHAGVYGAGTPNPPSGYHQTYAHNFTTQGMGDWVTQPGSPCTSRSCGTMGTILRGWIGLVCE